MYFIIRKLVFKYFLFLLVFYCCDKSSKNKTVYQNSIKKDKISNITTLGNDYGNTEEESSLETNNKNNREKKDVIQIVNKNNLKGETENELNQVNSKPRAIIVIIHGIPSHDDYDATVESFRSFEEGLEKNLHKENLVYFRLKNIGAKTSDFTKQGKDISLIISEEIKKNKYDKNIPIILVGHSDGSLASYSTFMNNNNKLGIIGIVSINGTWKGVNILDKSGLKGKYKLYVDLFTKDLDSNDDGVKDLFPDSNFIQKVHSHLKTCSIPIYCLGCTTNSFSLLFNKSLVRGLSISEEEMFGSLEHDGMSPLDSQLCEIGQNTQNLNSQKLDKHMLHGISIKNGIGKFLDSKFLTVGISKNDIEEIKQEPVMRMDPSTFKATANCIKKILKTNNPTRS